LTSTENTSFCHFSPFFILGPFRFTYFLKSTLWGGRDIVELKKIDGYYTVGESWEISPLPHNESLVVGGPYDGLPLHQLIEQLREKLVGRNNFERFGNRFPLLVKFLSTAADLSIQVHPDNEMAQEEEGEANGKSECWYVVKTGQDAALYCGFNRTVDLKTYDSATKQGQLPGLLARYETRPGDAFFIPAGQIHCIGANNFIIEIQQPSDVTYRVHDFDRRDAQGNLRQLHTEKARRALRFGESAHHHTHYAPQHNTRIPLEQHPEFTTALYRIDTAYRIDYHLLDSFVILIAFEGAARLTDNENNTTLLRAGETLLYPATTQFVDVVPLEPTFSCIETFVDAQ
jgi:phosphomannose isomerase type I